MLIYCLVPEQNAVDWLKGGDKAPLLISLDPARRRVWEKQLENGDQKSDTAPITSSSTHGKGFKESDLSSPTPHHVEPSIVSAASSTVATTNKPEVETSITPTAVLPPLQPNETHCSTSYKARIISHHIAQQLERHRNQDKRGPLMVGLQGPQGCGKLPFHSRQLTSEANAGGRENNLVFCFDRILARSTA